MEKYCFSNDFDLGCLNMGISEERHDEIFETAKKVAMRAMLFDNTIQTKSQGCEVFLNEIQPTSKVEAFWCGMIYADVCKQIETIREKMDKIIRAESE